MRTSKARIIGSLLKPRRRYRRPKLDRKAPVAAPLWCQVTSLGVAATQAPVCGRLFIPVSFLSLSTLRQQLACPLLIVWDRITTVAFIRRSAREIPINACARPCWSPVALALWLTSRFALPALVIAGIVISFG